MSPIEIWDHAVVFFLPRLQGKMVVSLQNNVLLSVEELQESSQGHLEPQAWKFWRIWHYSPLSTDWKVMKVRNLWSPKLAWSSWSFPKVAVGPIDYWLESWLVSSVILFFVLWFSIPSISMVRLPGFLRWKLPAFWTSGITLPQASRYSWCVGAAMNR